MLHSRPTESVQAETTHFARVVFPKRQRRLRVADKLATLFTAGASSNHRPFGGLTWRLTLAMIRQFVEAAKQWLLLRRMNHDHFLLSRLRRDHSVRHRRNSARRAMFLKLVGLVSLGGALTVLFWMVFSQD